MAAKRSNVEDELAKLKAATAEPQSPAATAALTVALESKHARLVAAAAKVVKARQLEGFTTALQSAYARFLEDPVKRDPNCQAKIAILEALDFTETLNEDPFVAATSLVQLEPAYGPPVDSAVPCRARAILALARIGHTDVVLHAGLLLADPAALVRTAAADALAATGIHHAAGVLLLKLEVGDEDASVLLACMSGVLSLAPALALARFVPMLREHDDERRELAALCLGQSTRADAGQALITALKECVVARERGVLLEGLGLHRSDAALEFLLEAIGRPSDAEAIAALRALAPRRFESGVRTRVEKAIEGRQALETEFARAFRDE